MSRNISVDVEADGPVPGLYSMISFGAVIVEPGFTRTFYGQLRPISDQWVPEALAVSGHSREQTLAFPEAVETMRNFEQWISANTTGRPIFYSDNNGFDFAFVNYYFHRFLGRCPFGWSSSNIGSLYRGVTGDVYASFKHLRDTRHTHHPVDDARGNAEALLKILSMMRKNRENQCR